MTERSLFWTTDDTGDGPAAKYAQARHHARFNATFIGTPADEGPILGYLNELAVSNPSGATLRTATGAAYVDGLFYENSANVDKTVTTPVVGTTGWRLVLQAGWAAQTVRITLLESTDGVATIPAVTQTDGTTWEVSLATGTITTGGVIALTDDRTFCHYNTAVSNAMMDADSVDSAQYVDGSIDTAHLANDAVDDTKVGDRVPQVYRRQGGSATDWSTYGTTTYTPGAVRIQCGAAAVINASDTVTVTFPTAFGYKPIVVVTYANGTGSFNAANPDYAPYVETVTTTGFVANLGVLGCTDTQALNWIAIGPE